MILNLNSIRFSFVAAIGALAAGSFFVRSVTAAAAPENENWPQWRGPLATGEAPTARPPLNWSEDKNLTSGKSKFREKERPARVIWKDSIFLLSAIPTGKKTDEKAQPENPQQGEQGRGARGARSEKPTEVISIRGNLD